MADRSKKIWNYLLKEIGNEYGVAGLMGNLRAESGLESTNAEDAYMNKMHMTDMQYTNGVDDGSYPNFVKDAVGYGLAQWTYHTRKKALLDFAKAKKKSIGDLDMQLAFLMDELKKKYKGVFNILVRAESIREASDAVLIHFENPANKSTEVQIQRCQFGEDYYKKYASKEEPKAEPKEEPTPKADIVMVTTTKGLRIRKNPNTECAILGLLSYGTKVELDKREKNWGHAPKLGGWICLDYTKNC